MLEQIKKLLSWKLRTRFLILAAIIALFSFPLLNSIPAKKSFAQEVVDCNTAVKELRFSCYRSVLEKHYADSWQTAIADIKNNPEMSFISRDHSYAIFGTNCHTFYHALGDFIATYSDTSDLENQLNLGPGDCTAGYTMGLYKRTALENNFQTDLLKKFYKICKKGQENQCAHEIGHLLHDKYTYSIFKVLDNISFTEYGLKPHENYQYTTFDKVDFNAPFEECEEIISDNNNLLAQCYTGVGHNLFLFSEFSPNGYKDQFSECASVADENKEYCYGFLIYRIGINVVAPKFLAGEFEEGKKICDEVDALANQEGLKHHCYIGVGGGIGLFIDSEYQLDRVNEDNLVEIKKTLLDYASLCNQSEEAYIDKCFAGLMGTKFKGFYKTLKIHHERIEKLLPTLDSDFRVVG